MSFRNFPSACLKKSGICCDLDHTLKGVLKRMILCYSVNKSIGSLTRLSLTGERVALFLLKF